MTTSYSTLLGLALPVQGELSGTWGTTVNDYITTYLDSAVAGTQTISGTQTAVTLSVANGTTLSQAGAGATGSSQYMVINCTGTPASLLTITAPGASKVYVVLNATAQSVKLVGTGPTTGVTLVTGEKAVCAWDGSDFVKVATSVADGVTTITFGSTGLTPNSATSGAVTVAGTLANTNGGTGATAAFTLYGVPYASSTTVLATTAAGTATTVLHGNAAGAPTFGAVSLTADVSGTLPNTNGGTGQSSAFTQYGVTYASTTSVLATTANGTTGQIFTATTGGAPSWAAPAGQTYPGVGIANSTGSAWGTSYSTSGSGTVVALATSPAITTSITTASTSFTALAGATTLLTLGGTGASSVLAIPGTLEQSSTTGALTVAGGVYIAKKLNVAGVATLANGAVLGTPASGTLSTCTVDGTDAVGFRNIPISSKSAAYTTVLADSGKVIFHPSTDANVRTFTIDSNANVAYALGTAITFINMTSQVVTIAITTDTMYLSSAGTTGSRSLAQYGSATAIKMTSTTWLISGSGLT